MSIVMTKSGQSWTAACPATSAWSVLASGEAPLSGAGTRYGGVALDGTRIDQRINGALAANGGFGGFGTRLRDLRDEQRVQDEQGRTVFGTENEDMSIPAPAHAPSAKGGASGPYPWRRPV
ncbi:MULTISPECIES: hypothetical protein [Actinomadura]|uniref:Uncharacterized protein n=1 Tax=Actinomadura yumaensis TaxID=111807 RepID=A0ABW2CBY9_9ACTN|nr:hypothetical protein [Actinomadura sp. J1-007]MWK33759.1 hypothetical protein [Actinomadura sp. J1-007]